MEQEAKVPGSSLSARPLITLTTDFGTALPYVAVMKGVILTRCPEANLVDLTHEIPAQNVSHAAYYLRDAVPWFPPGTIHVVVVDPGVGTSRLPLCVTINGQHLLCPDNGLWTLLEPTTKPVVHQLSNRAYQLSEISNTFHGRDVFAPSAAALANGVLPDELGIRLDHWQRLGSPTYRKEQDVLYGEVVFIDHFGNLITNIPAKALPTIPLSIQIGDHLITNFVNTYGQARTSELIALISSAGNLEIAEVNGHAARRLNASTGQRLQVS
jgi:S-adenosylmethionine hydrolase